MIKFFLLIGLFFSGTNFADASNDYSKEYSNEMLEGNFYYFGMKDYKKALYYFELASKNGEPEAKENLGIMYLWGHGVKKDYKVALNYFNQAYEGGMDVTYYLGLIYESGYGVKKDYKKAIRYYQEGSRNNYVDCQHRLGIMYFEGIGTESDFSLAAKLFEKAAYKGLPGSQYNLAVMYSKGWGIEKNFLKSYAWASIAASNELSDKQDVMQSASLRDSVEAKLTSQQIAQAQLMAREYLASKDKPKVESAPEPEKPKKTNQTTTGTAFLVNLTGHLLTNAHVVSQCQKINVYGESTTHTAQLVARDAVNDMAILKTQTWSDAKPISFSKKSVSLGQDIYAIGYPLPNVLSLDLQMTKGNVSAIAGLGNDSRFYQISAPVQSGNSGGPLVNGYGLVSGMVTSKANIVKMKELTGDFPQNVNFALKESQLKNYLETNGISYLTSSDDGELKGEQIAAQARKYTVLVECVK